MPTTREKIQQFLETFQPSSIGEIGKALNLTDPDILYHMRILLQKGEVELYTPADRNNLGRGRPVKRYRLRKQKQPENYSRLAKALLETLLSGSTPAEKQAVLLLAAKKLQPPVQGKGSFQARIARLVKHLSENQYAARWEAHHAGPRIIFTNCPYLEVASGCPVLCEMDRLIIEDYLATPVATALTFLEAGKSTRQCRFSIRLGA